MQRAEILRVCRLLPLPLLKLLLLLFWHFHADIIHSVVQAASVFADAVAVAVSASVAVAFAAVLKVT